MLIAFLAFTGDKILKMESPTLIEALDFGHKMYGGLRDSVVGGSILAGALFAYLCFTLVRNAQKTPGRVVKSRGSGLRSSEFC